MKESDDDATQAAIHLAGLPPKMVKAIWQQDYRALFEYVAEARNALQPILNAAEEGLYK